MSSPNDPIQEQSSQSSNESNNASFVEDMKYYLNNSAYGSALVDFGNNASSMASESINDIRNRVDGVSAGDVVQGLRGRIQSFTSGNQETNTPPHPDTLPDSKEIEHIDNMEKEKIIEYLQEKHKSTAKKPTTN